MTHESSGMTLGLMEAGSFRNRKVLQATEGAQSCGRIKADAIGGIQKW